jgi:hypothetical protein
VVGYYTTGGTAANFLPATPARLAKLTIPANHAVTVLIAAKDGVRPACYWLAKLRVRCAAEWTDGSVRLTTVIRAIPDVPT